MNSNASTFTDRIEQPIRLIKQHTNDENMQGIPIIKTPQNIPMIMTPILQRIGDNQMDITGNHLRWFSIGCALAGEYGEEGRYIFHAVSRFYKTESYQYTREETDIMYDSCLKNYYKYKYTIGTFYHWCKEYGLSLIHISEPTRRS